MRLSLIPYAHALPVPLNLPKRHDSPDPLVIQVPGRALALEEGVTAKGTPRVVLRVPGHPRIYAFGRRSLRYLQAYDWVTLVVRPGNGRGLSLLHTLRGRFRHVALYSPGPKVTVRQRSFFERLRARDPRLGVPWEAVDRIEGLYEALLALHDPEAEVDAVRWAVTFIHRVAAGFYRALWRREMYAGLRGPRGRLLPPDEGDMRGLREPQRRAFLRLYEAWERGHQVVYLTGGTGSGKTHLALNMAGWLSRQGLKVLFISTRRMALEDARRHAQERGLLSGHLHFAGLRRSPGAYPFTPDVVIVDEPQYAHMTQYFLFPHARYLMLTATPLPMWLYGMQEGAVPVARLPSGPYERRHRHYVLTPGQVDEPAIARVLDVLLDDPGARVLVLFPSRETHVGYPSLEDFHTYWTHTRPAQAERTFVMHGEMGDEERARVLEAYQASAPPVALLATRLIEAGVNLPGANAALIVGPERFGSFSVLQMAGRVGRYGETTRVFYLTRRYAPWNLWIERGSLEDIWRVEMTRGRGGLSGRQHGHMPAFDAYLLPIQEPLPEEGAEDEALIALRMLFPGLDGG